MQLRNRVRQVREERKLSQETTAELAGISRTTLSLIEQDNGHEPIGSVMTALCRTLDDAGLFWWDEAAKAAEAVA